MDCKQVVPCVAQHPLTSNHSLSALAVVAILAIVPECAAASYTLATTTSHGSVTANPAKASYDEGEVVTLIPKPQTGYSFTGWSGAVTSKRLVVNVTMDSDKAVTANFAPWTPPIGIPSPSFGISETYRMYDDSNVRDPSLTYNASPSGGYYTHYIDNSNPSSTDTSNLYGTVAKPRKTIPNPIPAGSVVEVHGGPYSTGGGSIFVKGYGSVSYPIFVRGVPGQTPPYFDKKLRVEGSYLVVENMAAVGAFIMGEYSGTRDTHHISVRCNDFYSLTQGPGSVTVLGSYTVAEGLRSDDCVVYANHIHDFGDIDSEVDDDNGGAVVGCLTKGTWFVDNVIHTTSGTGIQINAGSTAASTAS